jgi:hypothetical protein
MLPGRRCALHPPRQGSGEVPIPLILSLSKDGVTSPNVWDIGRWFDKLTMSGFGS